MKKYIRDFKNTKAWTKNHFLIYSIIASFTGLTAGVISGLI